jgi:hypothetical protein
MVRQRRSASRGGRSAARTHDVVQKAADPLSIWLPVGGGTLPGKVELIRIGSWELVATALKSGWMGLAEKLPSRKLGELIGNARRPACRKRQGEQKGEH